MFTLKLEQVSIRSFQVLDQKLEIEKEEYAHIEDGTGLVRSWLFPREVISKMATRAPLADYASINISSGNLNLSPLLWQH